MLTLSQQQLMDMERRQLRSTQPEAEEGTLKDKSARAPSPSYVHDLPASHGGEASVGLQTIGLPPAALHLSAPSSRPVPVTALDVRVDGASALCLAGRLDGSLQAVQLAGGQAVSGGRGASSECGNGASVSVSGGAAVSAVRWRGAWEAASGSQEGRVQLWDMRGKERGGGGRTLAGCVELR